MGLLKSPPTSLATPAVTPDISVRKVLRQGATPDEDGEGILSVGGDMSREGLCLGLPRSLSPDSGPPGMLSPPGRVSDFLFLLRRKFPLSNIFSQLGSSVQ